MATRRRKSTKRAPKVPEGFGARKSGRGGQSGGGNPNNDGRITEQQHEEAMRVLRAEYYQGVRGITEDLKQQLVRGEIDNAETLDEMMRQAVDGSYWVIYTHANFQVLMCSDHHDAYSEEYGEFPEGDSPWMALAFAAMERDVREQMEAEDVRAPLEEAPRGRMHSPLARSVRAREARGPRGLRRGR